MDSKKLKEELENLERILREAEKECECKNLRPPSPIKKAINKVREIIEELS